jgi:hypothetical protein
MNNTMRKIDEYKGTMIIYFDRKYMLVNKNYVPLLNIKFDNISLFLEDYAICRLNNKYTYIKYTGEFIKENLWFDQCTNFKDNIARVINNNKVFYINTNGDNIFNIEFDNGGIFYNGLLSVTLFGKDYCINKKGYIV